MRATSRNNLFLLAALLLTAACTANEENAPNQEMCDCRVTEEVYKEAYAAGTRTYFYTGEKLTRIENKLGFGYNNLPHPNNSSYYLFESDDQGHYKKVSYVAHTGDVTGYQTFEHNSQGLLIKINLINNPSYPEGSMQLRSYYELAYNTRKQLVSTKEYDANSASPFPVSHVTFTYDTKGNVSHTSDHRVQYHGPNNFTDFIINTVYTYDDKINPYKENAFSLYSFQYAITPLLLSQNNVLTSTSEATMEGTLIGPSRWFCFPCAQKIITYAYSYNDRNRPVTVVNNWQSTTSTFKYSCD